MTSASHATLQDDFARSLVDADQAMPAGVSSNRAARRFAVYRNNVVKSLIDALRHRFPVAERIVGEEFFIAMAQLYLRAYPPTSPVMAEFGDRLAEFVESFPPAAELPYLADVCRIEAARTRAYHAADAAALDAEAFAALAPERLMALRLTLHPSLELIRSIHPAYTIWAMHGGDRTPGPIESWTAEDIAVARPNLTVEVRMLPPGAATMLAALMRGEPLGAAADTAFASFAAFDLTDSLAAMIGARLVISLD